jgi:hypothetical protein
MLERWSAHRFSLKKMHAKSGSAGRRGASFHAAAGNARSRKMRIILSNYFTLKMLL